MKQQNQLLTVNAGVTGSTKLRDTVGIINEKQLPFALFSVRIYDEVNLANLYRFACLPPAEAQLPSPG